MAGVLVLQHNIEVFLHRITLFEVAGYALGAGTALLGKEAAMACTVAVEASITEHYNDQIRQLANTDPETHRELIETITKFRDEEQEHHDIGLENDAELAPAYQVFLLACLGWGSNGKLNCQLSLGLIWSNQNWMYGCDLAK